MKTLQIIIGILLLFFGLVLIPSGSPYTAIVYLLLGFSLFPYLFDKFQKTVGLDLSNSGKVLIRLCLFFVSFITIGIDAELSPEERKQRLVDADESLQSINTLIDNNDIDSAIHILDRAEDTYKIYADSVNEKAVKLKANLFYLSDGFDPNSVIDTLSEGVYNNFIDGNFSFQLGDDSSLNRKINSRILEVSKRKDDFDNLSEYYAFRAVRAKNTNNQDAYFSWASKAIRTKNGLGLHLDFFLELAHQYQKNEFSSKARDVYLVALKQYPDNSVSLTSLGDYYFERKSYSSGRRYYQKLLEKNDTTELILSKYGLCLQKTARKSQAINVYKRVLSKYGNNKEICETLNDLTKKFVRYRYYSRCCDGSLSNSTGRGTCSHHGGVCATLREPVYSYPYRCR